MTPVATFGPLITEVDVDRAVIQTLRKWLPTYLTRLETERNLEAGTFARPVAGSYANTLTDDEFLDHTLPAIIVTTAQLQDTTTTGAGAYSATWKVIVSSVVRGRTAPETRELAALFGATVRRTLLQQQDLDEFATEIRWVPGGTVAPVPDTTDKGRWLAAGINHFEVDVDDVLTTREGPLLPDPTYQDPDPENDPDQTYDQPVSVDTVNVGIETLERS